ncbi:PEGA domain-containing protein [Tepiditoga spiralis]|nr:PEGA domain-containing protein [Tepiditoga spiralis]
MFKKFFLLFFISIFSFLTIFAYNVEINSIKNSYVYIDNVYNTKSDTGKNILNLNGHHTLKIIKDGYTDFIKDLDINKDLKINAYQIPLSNILINSNLSKINIWYNWNNEKKEVILNSGESLKVPYTIKKIYIAKKGYNEKEINIELKPFSSTVLNIHLNSLQKCLIKTTPSNVKVYSNGTYIGTTPIELDKNYKNLILKKEEYVDYSIDELLNSEYNINLKKGKKLSINSNISDAIVIINKKYTGTTPFSKTLPVDNYFIEVKKLGYDSKYLNVDLSNNLNLSINLKKSLKKITLLNTENYEFNIDGKTIKGLNEILFDNKNHLLKIKNGDSIYSILIDEKTPEVLDFNKVGVLNVFSIKNDFAKVFDKIKNLPTQFFINMISERSTVTLKTTQNYYNLIINKGKYGNIFTEKNIGGIFVSSNINNTSYYLDGEYIGTNPFMYGLKAGTHEIEAKNGNKIKKEQLNIKNNNVYYTNFIFDEKVPVRLYTSKKIKINNIEINKTPYYFYLNKGANYIEVNNKKIVVFIYGPQSINIDDIL